MGGQPSRKWRRIFVLAGVFNLAPGLGLLFAPNLLYSALMIAGPGPTGFYPGLAGLLILGFGLGYFLLARDPAGNRSIALMGAIAKAGVFALALFHYTVGSLPAALLAVATADLAWAGIFLTYYFGSPAASLDSPRRDGLIV